MKKSACAFIPVFCAIMATGCQSVTGMGDVPDEFRIVTKSPLIIPPDYNLLPPQPGQTQIASLDSASPSLTFTIDVGENASLSEQALIVAADARAVSAVIHEQIDYEQAKIIRKTRQASDRLIKWDGENVENEKTDKATGGEPVKIGTAGTDRKLPGT